MPLWSLRKAAHFDRDGGEDASGVETSAGVSSVLHQQFSLSSSEERLQGIVPVILDTRGFDGVVLMLRRI
jgi:hypothetical protein